ncbi:MarR family winged helix-turn-helix transcriptional regulator [Martelella alba]|uniref:MarR family transcriptional regulator n=1 Tax=Martelella alba TaxID=2590451 RepID=A0ABY2SLQ1_9HYPH|nr:MarR family transcriptional regulator [Martelella alba]TKI06124.1 MarR family transcriptional regulator [Martelella alba]
MNDSQRDPDAGLFAMAVELRLLIGNLGRRLREQSHPGDYTLSQKAVILRLEREGPATVTALARAEGMRPQSMGATVASLEAAGLIAGAPDPSDGRQTLLFLTEGCRALLKSSREAREDWLYHAVIERFAPHEREQLATAIDLLKRLTRP